MARVTGIGGIFLKARDPKALSAWYAEHLGIKLSDYGGATMMWTDEIPAGTGQTVWSLFPEGSPYFGPAGQRSMVNYRVDDLDGLLEQLRAANVAIDPKRWLACPLMIGPCLPSLGWASSRFTGLPGLRSPKLVSSSASGGIPTWQGAKITFEQTMTTKHPYTCKNRRPHLVTGTATPLTAREHPS